MTDQLPPTVRHRPPCTDGDHCGEAAHCPPLPSLEGVLAEVQAERASQEAKWGEQNHPDGTGPALDATFDDHEPYALMLAEHNTDLARIATRRCDAYHRVGRGTWEHILTEEWAEALACDDPDELRDELLQVAAVAVAWVEAIDRRAAQS